MTTLQPTFDRDGYPTDETLTVITTWPIEDADGWIKFIISAWSDTGRIWHDDNADLHMATGGWSGNESIIHAMRDNHILWMRLWKSSHRGGKFVFELPDPIVLDKSTTNT